MKVQIIRATRIVLELTEGEASWLKGMMQNSLLAQESPSDAEYRSRFFNAIPGDLRRFLPDTDQEIKS